MTTASTFPQLVTASAGTGKTYWIVRRVLELLRDPSIQLNQIGIITFTEAAAAELRHRIGIALREAGDPRADQVAGAPISTIHGFALSLLKRHALYLGRSATMKTLGKAAAVSLSKTALNEVLADPAQRERVASLKEGLGTWDMEKVPELIFSLMDRARTLRIDAHALSTHAKRNREFLVAAFEPPGDPDALDATLKEEVTKAERVLPLQGNSKTDNEALEAARSLFVEAKKRWDRGIAERAATLPEAGKRGSEPQLAPVRAAGKEWVRRHPESLKRLQSLSDAGYELAARALERYEAAKEQLGCVDFNDQIGLALDLLEKSSGQDSLASYVAAEMPYLLVDEFQDTSPLQFCLVEVLRAHGTQVTCVGDMKQAIYGWRDADSRLMGALIESSGSSNLPPITLASNYRSHPDLVDFCNDLFADRFAASCLPFDRVQAAGPHRNAKLPSSRPRVELVLSSGRSYPLKPTMIARLRALIEAGTQIHDRDRGIVREACFGDVAILERGNQSLDEWAQCLEAEGIAYTREMPGWSVRPEVRGAIAWLRSVANPYDTQAIADFLCSDYLRLSPMALAPLSLKGLFEDPGRFLGSRDEWDGLVATLSEPAEREQLLWFREAWLLAREAIADHPLAYGVELALDAAEAELRISAYPDGAQRRANLLKIGELASALEASDGMTLTLMGLSGVTLDNFIIYLLQIADTDEDRQPLVKASDPDAVQLITMHNAKGLEFPIVLIPRLSTRTAAKPVRVETVWPSNPNQFLSSDLFAASSLRFVPPYPDVGDLRNRLGQAAADEARRAEELCLLYVAFTRARDYLLLGWLENPTQGTLQDLLGANLQGDRLCGHPVLVSRVTGGAGMAVPDPGTLAPASSGSVVLPPSFWRMEAQQSIRPEPGVVPADWEERALEGCLEHPLEVDSLDLGKAVHEALRLADLLGNGWADHVLENRLQQRWPEPIPSLALWAIQLVRAAYRELCAIELLREVPLVGQVDGHEVAGRVDVLLRTPAGWWVIDYKIDEADATRIVERHGAQLSRYRSLVKQSLGEECTIAILALGSGTLVYHPRTRF